MPRSRRSHPASKPPRLRGGAMAAFVLGGICLAAGVVGLWQYGFHGAVTIRPERGPATGAEALQLLATLAVVGSAFVIVGVSLRYRARWLADRLRGRGAAPQQPGADER